MNIPALPSAVVVWMFALVVGCPSTLADDSKEESKLVRFEENGKFGFKDRSGTIVVPAKYDAAKGFAFGLAPVNLGATWGQHPGHKDGGVWGYISDRDNVVVPIDLDYASEFFDGLAKVGRGEERWFIDPMGKTVFTVPQDASCGNFSDGLAPMCKATAGGESITEYVDKQGRTVFRVKGFGNEFHEGLAEVSVRNPRIAEGENMSHLSGFIDMMGKWAIEPAYAEVGVFSDGLAAIRPKKTTEYYGKGDEWGYINKRGEVVIRPRFNEAGSFHHGLAATHVGGELVVKALHVPPNWEGGEWQIIDKTGKVLKRSTEWKDIVEYAKNPASNN